MSTTERWLPGAGWYIDRTRPFVGGASTLGCELPRPPIHVLEGWWHEVPASEERRYFPTSVRDPRGWRVDLEVLWKGCRESIWVPTTAELAGRPKAIEDAVRNQLWFRIAGHVSFEPGWLKRC